MSTLQPGTAVAAELGLTADQYDVHGTYRAKIH